MRGTITNTGSMVLGDNGAGADGTWVIQVTAYSGLTSVQPEVSVDGTNWVAASLRTPLAPQTIVANLTANGIYFFDVPAQVKARLTGVGAGTAVVEAVASLRA